MDDQDLLDRIDRLSEEEHALYGRGGAGDELTEGDRERLRSIEVTLDRCWDLLRQRRARRDAGLAPDEAAVRGEATVEGYLQ